jgi:hypothetical protein
MSRRLATIGCALLLVAGASMSGCMFTGDPQLDEARSDPSPNLQTLHQRPTDVDNAMVVTFDENGRMFWEDMGRLWLTDRPSRLSREPQLRP